MSTKVPEDIEKVLNTGVIEPATSEWASAVVLAPRQDGSLRFCVKYRRLNTKTLGDANPLPRMEDCVHSFGDARIFRHWTATRDIGKSRFPQKIVTTPRLRAI